MILLISERTIQIHSSSQNFYLLHKNHYTCVQWCCERILSVSEWYFIVYTDEIRFFFHASGFHSHVYDRPGNGHLIKSLHPQKTCSGYGDAFAFWIGNTEKPYTHSKHHSTYSAAISATERY